MHALNGTYKESCETLSSQRVHQKILLLTQLIPKSLILNPKKGFAPPYHRYTRVPPLECECAN